MAHEQTLTLPHRIVSRKDLLKVARELERVRDHLVAQEAGGDTGDMQFSERLKSLFESNDIKQLAIDNTEELRSKLEHLADHAPTMRFIFAAEPDADFIKKLVNWIRQELSEQALLMFSVQPQIAGGYILTTDRRRYDASWRNKLQTQPLKLGEALRSGQ